MKNQSHNPEFLVYVSSAVYSLHRFVVNSAIYHEIHRVSRILSMLPVNLSTHRPLMQDPAHSMTRHFLWTSRFSKSSWMKHVAKIIRYSSWQIKDWADFMKDKKEVSGDGDPYQQRICGPSIIEGSTRNPHQVQHRVLLLCALHVCSVKSQICLSNH